VRRALEGLVEEHGGGQAVSLSEAGFFTVVHRGTQPLGGTLARAALAPVLLSGLRELLGAMGRRLDGR
jgi:hypothetical protein